MDATARRTWDKEEYARRARERLEAEERELAKKSGSGKRTPCTFGVVAPPILMCRQLVPDAAVLARETALIALPWLAAGGAGIRDGPPVQRDDLKARSYKVDLDSKLGKTRVIANQRAAAGGYHCDLCDCVIKDSLAFLDHINGKKRW